MGVDILVKVATPFTFIIFAIERVMLRLSYVLATNPNQKSKSKPQT